MRCCPRCCKIRYIQSVCMTGSNTAYLSTLFKKKKPITRNEFINIYMICTWQHHLLVNKRFFPHPRMIVIPPNLLHSPTNIPFILYTRSDFISWRCQWRWIPLPDLLQMGRPCCPGRRGRRPPVF